nr:receptor-like protein 12 [Ipomoea batatas]
MKLRALSVIYLDGNNLSSAVPGFLAKFSNLTTLSLSYCNLWGELPKSILQVQTLQHLELSNNPGLSGSFPVFQQNISLKTLSLSDTRFSGSLPDSIGHLHNLSRIELSNCSFVGAIPSTMAKLTSLAYVDFSYNNFTGSFPSFQMSKKLIYIDLSHNVLTGPLSFSHFEGLSELKHVKLGYNLLTGKIPPYLFSLPSLQSLYLNQNLLKGQVDEFDNASASQLLTLDLSSNRLNGSIPNSFFKLPKLSVLSLSSNFFSGKMQFNDIEKLPDLSELDLSYNNMTVDTTNSNEPLFSSALTVLNLASCKLLKFPDLRNQSKMKRLDLSDNQIVGTIPNWIWNVGNGGLSSLNLSCNSLDYLEEPYSINSSLSVIDLHSNRLQGNLPIPPVFALYVDYSGNNFSSAIPNRIGTSLVVAVFFSLSNNRFTGPIPDSVCNSSWVQVLDLSQNLLSGKIPSCLMNSSSIVVLDLRRNNLSGTIPDEFPDRCAVKTLDLSRNMLEGQMPESLVNCRFLEVLNVGNNKIADRFPCPLRSLSTLHVLVLHSNRFFGDLHCLNSNLSWKNLQIIDISSNKFSGKLDSSYFFSWRGMISNEDAFTPAENQIGFVSLFDDLCYEDTVTIIFVGVIPTTMAKLTSLAYVDFSYNNFTGPLPSFQMSKKLTYIDFSHNALTGPLSFSHFGGLSELKHVNLGSNLLSGKIPPYLFSLPSLQILYLNENLFHGKIPTGNQFQTFSEDSFRDNHELCGFPLNATCDNNSSSKGLPWPSSNGSQSDPKSKVRWEFVTSSLGFVVGLSGTLWLLLYNKIYSERFNRHLNSVLIRLFHQ